MRSPRRWTPRFDETIARYYFERRNPGETAWVCPDPPSAWNCSDAERALVAAALGLKWDASSSSPSTTTTATAVEAGRERRALYGALVEARRDADEAAAKLVAAGKLRRDREDAAADERRALTQQCSDHVHEVTLAYSEEIEAHDATRERAAAHIAALESRLCAEAAAQTALSAAQVATMRATCDAALADSIEQHERHINAHADDVLAARERVKAQCDARVAEVIAREAKRADDGISQAQRAARAVASGVSEDHALLVEELHAAHARERGGLERSARAARIEEDERTAAAEEARARDATAHAKATDELARTRDAHGESKLTLGAVQRQVRALETTIAQRTADAEKSSARENTLATELAAAKQSDELHQRAAKQIYAHHDKEMKKTAKLTAKVKAKNTEIDVLKRELASVRAQLEISTANEKEAAT